MNHNIIWAEVPGYDGRYIINPHGGIRRVYASRVCDMSPYNKHGEMVIRLSDGNGNRKEYKVARLVAAAFKPQPAPDMVLYHINGMKTDNYVGNLAWITRQQLGKLTGADSTRRPVVKMNRYGAVSHYSSARAAGRANHMSYQTVLDYCNGAIRKQRCAPDGFMYRWADDVDDADIENGMVVQHT